MDYILSEGWLPIVIWINKKTLDYRCIEEIVTLHQINCTNKTERTQEHVIRGDFKTTPVAEVNPNNGTVILNVKSGNKRRAENGRFC